jgi:S1-C subfamily serine protease
VWGNPGGLTDQFRTGYVAGQTESYGKTAMTVQIPGFFGDSGSGLFNTDGEVVGVTSVLLPVEYQGVVFYLMGYFPIVFTKEQLDEVGYVDPR